MKQRMKKRIAIPYSLLIVATCVAVYFMFRSTGLEHQLEKRRDELGNVQNELADYEKLLQIDSVLISGDVDSALSAYSQSLELNKNNRSLELRIALAKKFSELKSKNTIAKVDTIKNAMNSLEILANSRTLNRYDSLSFVLEKKQVQLNALRRQLEQKSFGEYLQFKSKKNNQLHYVGQVKNKKANGIGIALLDTGSRYEGEWKDNERHGEGKFYWPDGEHYEGSYFNDKRTGLGTYYWPNGEKYVGQWADDKRNGAGTFYGSDGEVVTKGIWKNDKLKEQREDKS
jgi:hypothetical protein